MPWSDWQPAEEVQRQAFPPYEGLITSAFENATQDVPPYPTPQEMLQPLLAAAKNWTGGATQRTRAQKSAFLDSSFGQLIGNTYAEASVRRGVSLVYLDALASFPTRNDFPNQLGDLEYGVDYIENPDTGNVIEYEDGSFQRQPGEFLRWQAMLQLDILTSTIGMANSDAQVVVTRMNYPEPPSDMPYDTDTAPPMKIDPDPLSDPETLFNGWMGTRSGVTTATNSTTWFDSKVQIATGIALNTIDTSVGDDQTYESVLTFPYLGAFFTQPRWRYWIPDRSWVRLLHRGDGLGMAPRRLRNQGTTNQAGRLRGSY